MKITPRLAITLTFIAFGMVMGGQIGAFPAIKLQAGLNEFSFGLLATIATLAGIIAMSTAGIINRFLDHRTVLLVAIPANVVALYFTTAATSIWTCALTWIILSMISGAIDIFMNAEAGVIEHKLKKPIFASFHAVALYAIGASGFISAFIAERLGLNFVVLATIPFSAAAFYAVYCAIPHTPKTKTTRLEPKKPLPIKILALIGIVLGLDVSAELTCIQWSGQLLAEMRPDLAAYSGLAVLFYGICNGTMRLFGNNLRNAYSDIQLVLASFFFALIGFITLSLQPSFGVSVAAFALIGMGLALVFPCMFAMAAHLAPQARASALGFATMVSGPPRILLPLLLGWLAQTYGFSTIFITAAISLVLAAGFTIWAGIEMKRRVEL